MNIFEGSGAKFSGNREYRYRLWRTWDSATLPALFILLNPSTADETKNDPTVERCERRARTMGFGGLVVANLFALRSTDPKALYSHSDPVGEINDLAILSAAVNAGIIICGWGRHGAYLSRGDHVRALLVKHNISMHCLGINKDGSPKHPLYVAYDVWPLELPR